MDDTAIHHIRKAFETCNRCYQAIRRHRKFQHMPADLQAQLLASEQEVQNTHALLTEYMDAGQFTPLMARETQVYLECHIEMIMDMISGMNEAFGAKTLN